MADGDIGQLVAGPDPLATAKVSMFHENDQPGHELFERRHSLATFAGNMFPGFIVYKDGANWKVKDALTGGIAASNSDIEVAIQYALDNLTGARTTKEIVRVIGSAEVGARIDIPDYTVLDLRGFVATVATGFPQTELFRNSNGFGGAGNEEIEIIGGHLIGNFASATANSAFQISDTTGLIIRGVKMVGFRNHGVNLRENVEKFEILHCDISGNGDDGITGHDGLAHGLIAYNKCYNMLATIGGSWGIELECQAGDATLHDIRVIGNHCYDDLPWESDRYTIGGILINSESSTERTRDMVVMGNECNGHSSAGIRLQGDSASYTLGCTISNNICNRNGKNVDSAVDAQGITINFAENFTVENNLCNENYNDGILVSKGYIGVISNNRCGGNGRDGIRSWNNASRHVTIENNILTDNGNNAIRVADDAFTQVINNKLVKRDRTVELAYDAQTAVFTKQQIVTGGTSGATGFLVNDSVHTVGDGTLILTRVAGTFVDGEALTDPLGGAAVANGGPTFCQYGMTFTSGPSDIDIHGNRFIGSPRTYSLNGVTNNRMRISDNRVVEFDGSAGSNEYVTEADGPGDIVDTATTDVITHGLSFTPRLEDIVITLGENPTNTPGAIFVTAIGATTFTVNCENDPGASGLSFAWSVQGKKV